MSEESLEVSEQLNNYDELDFCEEAETMAITLAAYALLKELYEENMISLEQLNQIRQKYEIPVD